jgi:peptidoglycan/LPS O-acetylase OafA/YrhL
MLNRRFERGDRSMTTRVLDGMTHFVRFGTRGTHAVTAPSKFRQDIQGLRALAVGIVVLDHAHIPGLSGGFIGVDVFFVISGFLITGLLLGDIAKHARVRFLNFYSRRAQRILPAATVVILVTCVASIALLGIIQARSVLVDGVWAVFFGANMHFASVGTNYFAASASTSPLQHYWSLAVEEQFYLVWPAVLGIVALVFRRKGVVGHVPRLPIALTLGVVGGLSLYLSVVQTSSNPTAAYFSTIDRTWELAVGALLAVALPWLGKIPTALRCALSWSGLVAIITAALIFTAETAIPGYNALLPVLGCAALLVGGIGLPRYGAHSLLSIRPLRFLGDISYSLYLWHWPILIIAAAYGGARDTLGVRVVLVVISGLIATLSYYGLENPLRHVRLLSQRTWRGLVLWPVATGLVIAIAVFGAPSVPFAAAAGSANSTMSPLNAVRAAVAAGIKADAVPALTDPGLLSASTDHVNLGSCSQYPVFTRKVCNLGDPNGTKTMVVFGNSHSVMWVPGLIVLAKQEHLKLYPVVKEACAYEAFPDLNLEWNIANECTTFYDWAKTTIKRLHPDIIVIGTFSKTPHWVAGETSVINTLKLLTPRLILLGDTPYTKAPAQCLLQSGATQGSCLSSQALLSTKVQSKVQAISSSTRVQSLDMTNLFCDDALCPAVINGLIPTWDGKHMTPQYSTFLAPALEAALNVQGTNVVPIGSLTVASTTKSSGGT